MHASKVVVCLFEAFGSVEGLVFLSPLVVWFRSQRRRLE